MFWSTPARVQGGHGVDRSGVTEEQLGERDRVDAEVEQVPPPSAGLRSRCSGSGGAGEPEVGVTWVTSPMAPSATSSTIRRMVGLVRIHMASIRNRPRSRGRCRPGRARSPPVQRERLLAEHRLAGLQAQLGRRVVGDVRGGHVDHVDVGVRGQLPPGAVRPGEAVLGRRTPGRSPGGGRPPPPARRAAAAARSSAKLVAMPPVARIPQRVRAVMGMIQAHRRRR